MRVPRFLSATTTRAIAVVAGVGTLGVAGTDSRTPVQATLDAVALQSAAEPAPRGLPALAWAAIPQRLEHRLAHSTGRASALEARRLKAGGRAGMNRFGWSVAVSGNTAIVGAPLTSEFGDYSGAAYVFVRDHGGPGAWGEVARLTASDAALGNPAGNQFGSSVAISGDLAIVGAVGTAQRGEFTGSAYVFERGHGGAEAWGQVAKLTASDAAGESYFGQAVAIDGDTAVVGAPANAGGLPVHRAGSIYVFMRNHGGPGAWGESQRLTTADALAGGLGFSVAISGDTAIAGAPFTANASAPPGEVHVGAAYVFRRDRSAAGTWAQAAKLSARDVFPGDVMGWSVAMVGDTTIVGAPGAGTAGAAYVFRQGQGADSWNEVTKLTPAGDDRDIQFGRTVFIHGEIAAVGAPDDDERGGTGSRSGSAYLFGRHTGGTNAWGEMLRLTAADGQPADQFGESVAVSGGIAIVGAPDLGAEPGAAYICPLDALSASAGACRGASRSSTAR